MDYLFKVSPEWAKRVGRAASVNWPVGLGGQGNEGVAGLVKQTPGALGYVELIFALQNSIPAGAVQNSSGQFVTPSVATFDSDWGSGRNRIQVGSFPSLPNDPASASEGRIAIRNSAAAIQDEISYRNTSGWPNINGNDGHSIYLLPQNLSAAANDSGGNWRPSSQGVYGAFWRGAGGG